MRADLPLPRLELPLRQQMLLAFSVVLLAFTTMLGFFVDHQLTESAVEARAQQAAQDAGMFAKLIDTDIDRHLVHIRVRADNVSNSRWLDDLRALRLTLDRLQSAEPQYSWIGLADPQGKVVSSTQGILMGADVSSRDWFQRSTQGPIVVDVHEAKLLAKLLPALDPQQPLRFIDVAAPAHDERGRVIGILGAHLSVDWLSKQIQSYASSRLGSSEDRPAVIGGDGELRFGNVQALAGLDTPRLLAAVQRHDEGWLLLDTPGEGPTIYGFARHKTPAMTASNIDWVTVMPVGVDSVMADMRPTRLLALGGVMLMGVLAWLTFYFMLRLAGRPVRQLMDQVRQAQQNHQPLAALEGLPQEFGEIRDILNGFLGSLQERERELEKALEELRESFTEVSETFPGVLFRLEALPDGQAEFTYLSPSADHYLKVEAPAMPLPVHGLFGRYDVAEINEHTDTLMAQVAAAQSLDMSFCVVGKDGVRRHMRVMGHLRGKGRGRRIWQGVIFDISDLFLARRAAAEADEAKSRFLATMSHEIRTPLNGILGFAQLLHDEIQDEARKADVRKIIETAEVLTRILNDILDFSRIEEGKLLLESRPFNLSELIESSASLFHADAKRRGLAFVVQAEVPHDARLLGDPTRLKQVVNNLLSNAMKFTLQGHVRLAVDCEVGTGAEALLRVRISDTGIGMAPEVVQRLFQRFEQADAGIFRRFGGTGLGLAICKGIVDAMGGRLAVESQLGKGTSFLLEVPLRRMTLAADTLTQDTNEPLPHLDVLVVDDVPMNRELIARMLRAGGHSVREAADGDQAVALAEAQRFDLILMDIDMPVMDGLEASRQIRNRPCANRYTPIIALTGHAFEDDVLKAKASGIDEHLAKPIVFTKLKQKIRAVLQARAALA